MTWLKKFEVISRAETESSIQIREFGQRFSRADMLNG